MPAYDVVKNWERLPDGITHGDVADVAIGPGDDVYIVTRKGYAPEDAVLISTMMTDVHVADIADLPITERAVIVDTASPMRMRLP